MLLEHIKYPQSKKSTVSPYILASFLVGCWVLGRRRHRHGEAVSKQHSRSCSKQI